MKVEIKCDVLWGRQAATEGVEDFGDISNKLGTLKFCSQDELKNRHYDSSAMLPLGKYFKKANLKSYPTSG